MVNIKTNLDKQTDERYKPVTYSGEKLGSGVAERYLNYVSYSTLIKFLIQPVSKAMVHTKRAARDKEKKPNY